MKDTWEDVHDLNVSLAFVHCVYVVGGLLPPLTHVLNDCKYLKGDEGYLRRMQRMLGRAGFECGNCVRSSFVMVEIMGKMKRDRSASSFHIVNEWRNI